MNNTILNNNNNNKKKIVEWHKQYVVINDEWELVNRRLSSYLEQLLCRSCSRQRGILADGEYYFDNTDLRKYEGIGVFYLRKIYRHEYVGGGSKCERDPWNRLFPIFPRIPSCNSSNTSTTMSSKISPPYHYEYFYSSIYEDDNDVRNVCVVNTSVHNSMVYCVDILRAGV
jgi:hypothetical protein